MDVITVDKLKFKLFINEPDILSRIEGLSEKLTFDYKDQNPVFLCVLNGSFFFTAELLKHFKFDYEIAFVRVKSYDGLSSSNEIKEFIGLDFEINDRPIVILEDIVIYLLYYICFKNYLKRIWIAGQTSHLTLCKSQKYVSSNLENLKTYSNFQ